MEEYKLSDQEWDNQLRELTKAYHKGVITYCEYIIKQNEIIVQALMKGIPFDTINQFSA